MNAELRGDRARVGDDLRVLVGRAVGEVQAQDVGAARNSERRIAGSREAGPMVATIFVRFCRSVPLGALGLRAATAGSCDRLSALKPSKVKSEREIRDGPALSGATGGELPRFARASRAARAAALHPCSLARRRKARPRTCRAARS